MKAACPEAVCCLLSADRMTTPLDLGSPATTKQNRVLNKTFVVQVDLLFVFVVEAVCCLLSAGLRAVQLVSDKKISSSRASLYTTR
jgi:hypothetical protein